MSMTKREKILIVFVLILAVVCVYYIYFLQPCLKEITDLNSQKDINESNIRTNEQIKLKIEELTQKISDDEKKISKFSDSIFSAIDQPDVIVYLYNTINKYGQKVITNFNSLTNAGQIKVCSVSVTFNGTYNALKCILKELSEGEYLVKVTELTAAPFVLPPVELPQGESTASPTPKATDEQSSANQSPAVTDLLSINLTLEFYYIGTEISPGKTYPFTEGAIQYGGDIFQ